MAHGDTTEAMRWNVILVPLDDLEHTPTRESLDETIRACVRAFKVRLKGELRRGRVIVGYGPTEENL